MAIKICEDCEEEFEGRSKMQKRCGFCQVDYGKAQAKIRFQNQNKKKGKKLEYNGATYADR